MSAALELVLAGEPVVLLADRAIYWPSRGRLLIADLHLGKGDTLRAAGIAVPTGGSAHDLMRLDRLIEATGARALWILGDMLHGPRIDSSWRPQWLAFRHRHAALEMVLVAGNHDRVARQAALGITIVDGDAVEAPFLFAHAPGTAVASGLHRLCGHLHPVVSLPGLPRRHPAFVLDDGQTILPAFSAFTGGWAVDPRQVALAACVGAGIVLVA